jgi:hypothetical protein
MIVCMAFQEYFCNPASLTPTTAKWQKFTSSLMVNLSSVDRLSDVLSFFFFLVFPISLLTSIFSLDFEMYRLY